MSILLFQTLSTGGSISTISRRSGWFLRQTTVVKPSVSRGQSHFSFQVSSASNQDGTVAMRKAMPSHGGQGDVTRVSPVESSETS